jgi:hypothetical protein
MHGRHPQGRPDEKILASKHMHGMKIQISSRSARWGIPLARLGFSNRKIKREIARIQTPFQAPSKNVYSQGRDQNIKYVSEGIAAPSGRMSVGGHTLHSQQPQLQLNAMKLSLIST